MAIYAANSTYFSLGTYDLSDHVSSGSLTINYDAVEITAMNDTAHKYSKGLASHSIQVTLYLDQIAIAAGAVRAVLDSLKGTTAAFIMAPAGSTFSTTNPKYTGSVFVNGYTPINGSIGEAATVDLSLDVTTDITIAYA
jgi:hypothetical protein